MTIDLKEVNTVVSSEQSQLPLQVLKNPEKVVNDDKSRRNRLRRICCCFNNRY